MEGNKVRSGVWEVMTAYGNERAGLRSRCCEIGRLPTNSVKAYTGVFPTFDVIMVEIGRQRWDADNECMPRIYELQRLQSITTT
jgi:hypothetical protein